MRSMLRSFYTMPLVIYLAVMLIAISTIAGPAEAMFVPSAPSDNSPGPQAASSARTDDIAKIQVVLESKIIQQKLMDHGLSPEETMIRLNKLSDEQIHQLATHTDALEAGGDPLGFLVGVVILALLVVLLIYLLQGRIQIT